MKISIDFNKLLHGKKEWWANAFIITSVLLVSGILLVHHLTPRPKPVMVIQTHNADSVISLSDSIVSPILYKKMPDLEPLEVTIKKKRFIDVMLPTILLAKEILKEKRSRVEELSQKSVLAHEDSVFLNGLFDKFKAKDINDLLFRMKSHPSSIVLAQAATESAWGTSRFCLEANNIFGVWSFNENDNRIAAGIKRGDKTIYLKKYDSLLGSVMDYFYTIGRGGAFEDFRKVRTTTDNPYRLIWFLTQYSEKRLNYVVILRNMLEHSDLEQYDKFVLSRIEKKDKTWKALLKKY